MTIVLPYLIGMRFAKQSHKTEFGCLRMLRHSHFRQFSHARAQLLNGENGITASLL